MFIVFFEGIRSTKHGHGTSRSGTPCMCGLSVSVHSHVCFHMESRWLRAMRNCWVQPESSRTLSVMSRAAPGDGYCRAAVLVLTTMSFSFSQSALLCCATLLRTSGDLAWRETVSPMNTSLWALRMTNLLWATKILGGWLLLMDE